MDNRIIIDSIMNEIKKKIEILPGVTTHPIFGYQCYSVNGKFFLQASSHLSVFF